MSITALPVTAWAETPAESAVTGAETATDHVDENAVDEKQAAGTEQRLNYMYIDQPYLETPNTQKVVVSWGDGSEGIEQMTATVQGPVGEEVSLYRAGKGSLFCYRTARYNCGKCI